MTVVIDGTNTPTAGGVGYGDGTELAFTSAGTSGQVLTSAGSSAPTWQDPVVPTPGVNAQTFTSSGTWTKPTGYGTSSRVLIQVWGGGGSGGKHTYAGGGGGGGYNETWLFLSQLGATETITIGSGGAGKTTQSAGNAGGTSSVGSLISAYGGGAGNATSVVGPLGGGGGGQLSAGRNGGGNTPSVANGWGGSPQILTTGMLGQTGIPNPYFGNTSEFNFLPQGTANLGRTIACAGNTITYPANQHGGGGGTDTNTGTNDVYRGGDSIWGGGGGGAGNATYGTGGTSTFGGAGGAGKDTTDGVAGTQPAGGGGATNTGSTSGAGGDGKVIITVFYGA